MTPPAPHFLDELRLRFNSATPRGRGMTKWANLGRGKHSPAASIRPRPEGVG